LRFIYRETRFSSLFRFGFVLLVQRSVQILSIEIKKALAVKQVLFANN